MRPAACALALLAVTASGSAGSAATAPDPLPCPIGATRHAASSVRPHYVLAVKVGHDRFALSGTERIDFAASKRVDRIVLRLWPNSLAQTGARITVSGVRTPGRTSRAAQPDRTTLVVTLAAPARRVRLELAWRLRLPPANGGRLVKSYGDLRLLLLILGWNGRAWQLDPGSPLRGETATSPTADFDV